MCHDAPGLGSHRIWRAKVAAWAKVSLATWTSSLRYLQSDSMAQYVAIAFLKLEEVKTRFLAMTWGMAYALEAVLTQGHMFKLARILEMM